MPWRFLWPLPSSVSPLLLSRIRQREAVPFLSLRWRVVLCRFASWPCYKAYADNVRRAVVVLFHSAQLPLRTIVEPVSRCTLALTRGALVFESV